MLIDASLSFIGAYAPPVSFVSAVAGLVAQIGIPIDLLGQGVGTAPQNIIGNAALFGQDPGSALIKPFIRATIGVAAATVTSATLRLRLEYAPDTGVGGGYQPGAWQVIQQTGDITAAQLTANAILPKLEFEPVFPNTLRPRYLRLMAQINPTASGIFTAGTIAQALVVLGADEFAQKLATKNFLV